MDDNNYRSGDPNDSSRTDDDLRPSRSVDESRHLSHAPSNRRERRRERLERIEKRPASRLPPEPSERALEIPEIITLPADEIVMDLEWNARSGGKLGTAKESEGYAADISEQLTDEQLRDDIAERGVLQPVRVRRVDDEWHLVFGFRRVRACLSLDLGMPVICTVQPSTDDEDTNELEAAIANLSENQHRRELRTFEVANKLWAIHQLMPPDTTYVELATYVNYSVSYVSSLMRLKKNACAELWTLFCKYGARYGNGVTYKDMLDITKQHSKHEQLEAWGRLMEERTATAGKRKGRRKKGGGNNKRKLALALERVEHTNNNADIKLGMRTGLELAFGARTWRDADVMPTPISEGPMSTEPASAQGAIMTPPSADRFRDEEDDD